MVLSRSLLLAAALVRAAWPATLAISTYLKDGFTPTAIALGRTRQYLPRRQRCH
jgi:hypothetical protein